MLTVNFKDLFLLNGSEQLHTIRLWTNRRSLCFRLCLCCSGQMQK